MWRAQWVRRRVVGDEFREAAGYITKDLRGLWKNFSFYTIYATAVIAIIFLSHPGSKPSGNPVGPVSKTQPQYHHCSDPNHHELSPEPVLQPLNSLLLPWPLPNTPYKTLKNADQTNSVTVFHNTFLMAFLSEQKQTFLPELPKPYKVCPAPTPTSLFNHSLTQFLPQCSLIIPPKSQSSSYHKPWHVLFSGLQTHSSASHMICFLTSCLCWRYPLGDVFPHRPIYSSPRPTRSPFSPTLWTTTLFDFSLYTIIRRPIYSLVWLSIVHLPTLKYKTRYSWLLCSLLYHQYAGHNLACEIPLEYLLNE